MIDELKRSYWLVCDEWSHTVFDSCDTLQDAVMSGPHWGACIVIEAVWDESAGVHAEKIVARFDAKGRNMKNKSLN